MIIYFFTVVFFTHILQAIAGFGSTSIGIPFLSLALGTESSVLLLSVAGIFLCLLVAVTHRNEIRFKELLIILAAILPVMPAGFFLYARLRSIEWALHLLVGSLVTFIAGRELWRRYIKKNWTEPSRRSVCLSLAAGAVIEGMFSMGSAFINHYALTKLRDKGAFRATMVCVWMTTNSAATLYRHFVLHAFTPWHWSAILYSIPLIVLAFVLGNMLHHKVPNEKFAAILYGVQLTSGLMSLASGIVLLI
ncbi:MAG TPA: sulfite exporter TauE/SafE family protein [Clostridiaceae bacterium]|nr:sulfite exporter TauE/SafE family protein [Clostridiaceae bacterium]